MLEHFHIRPYRHFFRWPTTLRPVLGAACLLVFAGCGEPLVPDPPPSPAGPSVAASVASGTPRRGPAADAATLPSVKEVVEGLSKPGCVIHYRTLSDLYDEYRVELELSPSALDASGFRFLLYGVNVTVKRPADGGGEETLPKGLGLRTVCRIPDTELGESETRAWIEAFLREKGIDVAAASAEGSAARGPVAEAARLAWSGVREVWRRLAPRPLNAAQSTTTTEFDCETWAETGDAGISCTGYSITVTCPFGFDYEMSSGLCVGGTSSSSPISVIVNHSSSSGGGTPADPGDNNDDDDDEVPEGCGDERDDLAAEYARANMPGWSCEKFSTSHPSLIKQDIDTENGVHKGYGYISSALLGGITDLKSSFEEISDQTFTPTSGYRCPNGNAHNPSGNRSYHVHGQAVDFYTTIGWTEDLKDEIKDWGDDNAVESINYPSADGNHNHLAWEN